MPRFMNLALTVLVLVLLASPPAVAADAGDGGATDAGAMDAGAMDAGAMDAGAMDDDAAPDAAPMVAVACGGALCDTTNSATCGIAKASPIEPTAPALAISGLVVALGIARQMQRRKDRAR